MTWPNLTHTEYVHIYFIHKERYNGSRTPLHPSQQQRRATGGRIDIRTNFLVFLACAAATRRNEALGWAQDDIVNTNMRPSGLSY